MTQQKQKPFIKMIKSHISLIPQSYKSINWCTLASIKYYHTQMNYIIKLIFFCLCVKQIMTKFKMYVNRACVELQLIFYFISYIDFLFYRSLNEGSTWVSYKLNNNSFIKI